MKSPRRIRRMQRINRVRSRAVHLNLVSMIDVFAVLVFFLLLSASLAAERLNKLGLDLPSPNPTQQVSEPPRTVVITIRRTELELSDLQGNIAHLPNTTKGRDVKALAAKLIAIKRGKPDEQQITLLTEPDIPYEALVQVMDAARVLPIGAASADGRTRDLFPQISIGDATAAAGAAP